MSSVEKVRLETGSYRPIGDPEIIDNGYFRFVSQLVKNVDPETGIQKLDEHGNPSENTQNFTDIKPGVLVVAEALLGRRRRRKRGLVAVKQERYATNLLLRGRAPHFELPGGGIDAIDYADPDGELSMVAKMRAVRREGHEEAGLQFGDELIPIGNNKHGVIAHPYSTGHNFTFYAPGAYFSEEGPERESTEAIDDGEVISWYDAESMIIDEAPESRPDDIISAAHVMAALYQVRIWKERHADLRSKVIDLGQFRNRNN